MKNLEFPENHGYRKVNLLFVMLQLDAGGSERVVLDLVQHVDKRRFSVFVATFSGGQLHEEFSRACTKLFFVRKGRGLDLAAMLRLGAIIRHYRIDVINPHHYSPFVYSYMGSKVLNNRSLVFTEHSVPEVTGLSVKHKLLCNALFFRTNAIVGVSDEICKAFEARFLRIQKGWSPFPTALISIYSKHLLTEMR
ncbi:MAG: glycosyltransferase [Deltaproteobacteria bacterium]|nr:glycosyltransferase [Deltaproteobacteria bacterium]